MKAPVQGRGRLVGPAVKMRRSRVEGLTGQGGSHHRSNISTAPRRETGLIPPAYGTPKMKPSKKGQMRIGTAATMSNPARMRRA